MGKIRSKNKIDVSNKVRVTLKITADVNLEEFGVWDDDYMEVKTPKSSYDVIEMLEKQDDASGYLLYDAETFINNDPVWEIEVVDIA